MSLVLFMFIHILIGLALVYLYGKLPKAIMTFTFVFFTMSFIYWGVVLTNSVLN